jgi:integrase
MPKPKITDGPIGHGYIDELRTDDGVRFVARWQKFVPDPDAPGGRRRVHGGQYDIGLKVYHGAGLKSKKDAEKEWLKVADSIMGRAVGNVPAALKAKKTFRWFAEEDPEGFRKSREERWSGSTPEWYDYVMGKIILPKFGDVPLNEMNEPAMQAFLNQLATDDYSESVVKNTKTYLNAVLETAKGKGILAVNPAFGLIKPRHTRKPRRNFITPEEYQGMVAVAPTFRDKLMMAILYICGLRRGELFGLQWRDWNGTDTLMIERQILESLEVGPAKSDGSVAPVVVPTDVAANLNEWRKWCPNPQSEGWIFSSPRKAHINPGFWRKKVLIPAGKAIGIPKQDFHSFRRGFATEAHSQGASDKSIQAQLRHAQVSTTRELYMQPIAEDQRAAVENFSKVVKPN